MAASTRRPPMGQANNDNEFGVRKFTGGAVADNQNHHTDELPEYTWSGRYVTMVAIGGDCHFAFTRNPSAEVDRTITATEAGATTKVGGILFNGIPQDFELPTFNRGDNKLYFARESNAAAVVVYVYLSDDRNSA